MRAFTPPRVRALAILGALIASVGACSSGQAADSTSSTSSPPSSSASSASSAAAATSSPKPADDLLPGMPAPLSPTNVYAADSPNNFSPTVQGDRALVYVPNSKSNSVTIIDQQTMAVIGTYPITMGTEPQHVVPSYDLKTLYVASDLGPGSLTPIDPKTGQIGAPFLIDDPYNLYFTPDGRHAIVVAEDRKRLDFYDPHTWQVQHQLSVPGCAGIDHVDFTANGRRMLVSCEFADRMAVVDVATETVLHMIDLPHPGGMPQDVKLSPDGSVFYVADMMANGIYVIDGNGDAVKSFIATGKEAHGLYIDRSATRLLITNRGEGSISVLDLATGQLTAKWVIPGGGSPDMGNLSADGSIFWVAGRYNGVVYAISTVDGHLIKKIPVGKGPHGLCVWPQPGRYSLGHTGILR